MVMLLLNTLIPPMAMEGPIAYFLGRFFYLNPGFLSLR